MRKSFMEDNHKYVEELFVYEYTLTKYIYEIISLFVFNGKFDIINLDAIKHGKVKLSRKVAHAMFVRGDSNIREYLYTIMKNRLRVRRFFILHSIKTQDISTAERICELNLHHGIQFKLDEILCKDEQENMARTHIVVKFFMESMI